jgi:heptosyltransferase III
MTIKKKINDIRRDIFRIITQNIGTKVMTEARTFSLGSIKTVLVIRPNHRLGNQLMITPLIQELSVVFPDCSISLFLKGNLGSQIFSGYSRITSLIMLPQNPWKNPMIYLSSWLSIRKKYDLVINVDEGSSSGRIGTRLAIAPWKIYGADQRLGIIVSGEEHHHMAIRPVLLIRNFLQSRGYDRKNLLIPVMDLRLSNEELMKGFDLVRKVVKQKGPMISLFTHATGEKKYPRAWWQELFQQLSSRLPIHSFVEILPMEDISQIDRVAPVFRHSDIRVVGSLIAQTQLFIGADSGVMHLASAVGTPTVGLFSITDVLGYRPYNKGSSAIDTGALSVTDVADRIVSIALDLCLQTSNRISVQRISHA